MVFVPSVRYGWKPLAYGSAERPEFRAVVRTVTPPGLPVYSMAKSRAKGVARPRVDPQREDRPLGLALGHPPLHPAREAVDGVVFVGFGQRHLVVAALEIVGAVRQTVGPGDERLTVGAGGHLVRPVAVEH